jgi:hypothetical protein
MHIVSQNWSSFFLSFFSFLFIERYIIITTLGEFWHSSWGNKLKRKMCSYSMENTARAPTAYFSVNVLEEIFREWHIASTCWEFTAFILYIFRTINTNKFLLATNCTTNVTYPCVANIQQTTPTCSLLCMWIYYFIVQCVGNKNFFMSIYCMAHVWY